VKIEQGTKIKEQGAKRCTELDSPELAEGSIWFDKLIYSNYRIFKSVIMLYDSSIFFFHIYLVGTKVAPFKLCDEF